MRTTQKLRIFRQRAAEGKFVSFQYQKDNGDTSKRVIRVGGDIAKRMEIEGKPLNGRGNWASGFGRGLRSFLVMRNGETYVRGTDVSPGQKSQHKIFKVSGISDIK